MELLTPVQAVVYQVVGATAGSHEGQVGLGVGRGQIGDSHGGGVFNVAAATVTQIGVGGETLTAVVERVVPVERGRGHAGGGHDGIDSRGRGGSCG